MDLCPGRVKILREQSRARMHLGLRCMQGEDPSGKNVLRAEAFWRLTRLL
jgi:hypothetical protein